jgi:hypothetical protein
MDYGPQLFDAVALVGVIGTGAADPRICCVISVRPGTGYPLISGRV